MFVLVMMMTVLVLILRGQEPALSLPKGRPRHTNLAARREALVSF
jgi:hypothetical protein